MSLNCDIGYIILLTESGICTSQPACSNTRTQRFRPLRTATIRTLCLLYVTTNNNELYMYYACHNQHHYHYS